MAKQRTGGRWAPLAEVYRVGDENRRLKAQLALATRVDGLPKEAAAVLVRLEATFRGLYDDADPTGPGRELGSNGPIRRKFDQPSPGRTPDEARANAALRRLIRAVTVEIDYAVGAAADGERRERPDRSTWPECSTCVTSRPPYRKVRAAHRSARFCHECGQPYTVEVTA